MAENRSESGRQGCLQPSPAFGEPTGQGSAWVPPASHPQPISLPLLPPAPSRVGALLAALSPLSQGSSNTSWSKYVLRVMLCGCRLWMQCCEDDVHQAGCNVHAGLDGEGFLETGLIPLPFVPAEPIPLPQLCCYNTQSHMMGPDLTGHGMQNASCISEVTDCFFGCLGAWQASGRERRDLQLSSTDGITPQPCSRFQLSPMTFCTAH